VPSSLLSLLADLLLADLVLPRDCAGCGRPGATLCERCRPSAPAARVPVTGWDAAGQVVFAAGRYDGGVRAALIAYKERGRAELARPLGTLLAAAVSAAVVSTAVASAAAVSAADAELPPGGPPPCLVPVPSSARASRRRGGDHALRLARAAGRIGGLPVVPALRLARQVRDSAGLGRQARAANLAGAFVAAAGHGRHAVLVDDIVTTGATLREAHRALCLAGWDCPAAAVVAATPKLYGSSATGGR
jgi:predicted amidophosphoribosyltransferase